MKIRLSTFLLALTSIALAFGWIYERQQYESALIDRLETQIFDVRDVESEIIAAIKNNSFVRHSLLLDEGVETKERFNELRRNRLLENVVNLYRMESILRNNQFNFSEADKFVSSRRGDLTYYAGESLSFLEIKESEKLASIIANWKDVLEVQDIKLIQQDGKLTNSFADFVDRSIRSYINTTEPEIAR